MKIRLGLLKSSYLQVLHRAITSWQGVGFLSWILIVVLCCYYYDDGDDGGSSGDGITSKVHHCTQVIIMISSFNFWGIVSEFKAK
ncbi:hypothetical protein M0802_008464 [Mischocyttarus mexicanus]|nr:hypothetical protein M0802_008464 [Mischocyttarus mexicanus]